MSKLTLSIDDHVVVRAKRFAKENGTSVSRLVERYLDGITRPLNPVECLPVLDEIRGVLRTGSLEEYRQHLIEKHR